MRLRLERRIAYLQNILNVRYPEGWDKVPYPTEINSTVQVSPLVEPPPVDTGGIVRYTSYFRNPA